MKLSLIIPTLTLTKELESMAFCAIKSYEKQVNEIIVAEDGGFFSKKLSSLAEVYIHSSENMGFVRNVNNAWRFAQGDYVAIVNSDTLLHKGKLADLCIPGKITSPITKGQDVPLLAGHFFVVPRTFGVALFNERLHTFCSDADLENRYRDKIIQVPSVEIYHEINATLKVAGMMDDKQLTKDREILYELC